jgi:hypothetical protein
LRAAVIDKLLLRFDLIARQGLSFLRSLARLMRGAGSRLTSTPTA